MKLVTGEEMRLAEQAAVGEGASWEALMDRAGRAVADEVLSRLEGMGDAKRRSVLILAGPGNNGGDALVAAQYLFEAGLNPCVYLWKRKDVQKDALVKAVRDLDMELLLSEEDSKQRMLRAILRRSEVVIDGLLGMGLERDVEGELKEIVELVNRAGRPLVVAIDLPTGIHADTGQVLGAAVRSTVTVTMAAPKRGLYQFPGAEYAGEIVVGEIGIAAKFLRDVSAQLVDENQLRRLLPARPADAHKGTFGRLLVVAGSLNYTGAPYLAAMAGYRVGAGLVTLAPPRGIFPVLASQAVEATYLPLPEGQFGAIGEDAVTTLVPLLERYQAMVLGCGLGQENVTVAFVRRLLQARDQAQPGIGFLAHSQDAGPESEWQLPSTVIDADALNALVGVGGWWEGLPAERVVLTPHVGEMARLFEIPQEEVLGSRAAVAQEAAGRWGQVVVLKGAHTVVAHPDGRLVFDPVATPVLATAGTGDVLAGAIGGFLAQGVPPFEAAMLGVHIHGMAGELLGGEVGLAGGIAGDLLNFLPQAVRRLGDGA